jgi:signal transduction histidine kinase
MFILFIFLYEQELYAADENDHSIAARVARVFSSEMQQAEARLKVIERELDGLPKLLRKPFSSRYGFRSNILIDQNNPEWVQIDLGKSWSVDRIVAVPVHIPDLGEEGDGYGFPLRFKIEISDDENMEGAVTVVDRTSEDVVNPGRFPMTYKVKPTQGRYIRFTSTKHSPFKDGFIWAMEELLVLSGNITMSVGRHVTASSTLGLFPNWGERRINDGMSALGLPVNRQKSPNSGYQSAVTKDFTEEKWLVVDLGKDYLIDEIRLLPLESDDFQTMGFQSFPRQWKVELANDPEFNEVTWRHKRGISNVVGFPGGCAMIVSYKLPSRGRYLRFTAQQLWSSDDKTGFSLTEIQAYSEGENVALRKSVRAKGTAEGSSDVSSPEFLTDGFSGKYRLVEYPEYLDLIGLRGELLKEQASLFGLRDDKVRVTGLLLVYGGSGLGLLGILSWSWLMLKRRTMRNKAVAQLRDQIARDLHDDIGSNLGGIVLLSQMGSLKGEDAQSREDFKAIKDSAEETAKSMQDIVWLIERGNTNLQDLVTRMRQSTEIILGDKLVSLTVEPANFRDRELSLLARRHLYLAFKEALNNVRRHAEATAVEVSITIDGRDFSFEIRDNGKGFDPQGLSASGHGLANLQRRADRLAGSCLLESSPGHGTRVFFKASLNAKLT